MASRSRTTFKKRQKELNRQEKQRDKAAKRMQRKLEKRIGGGLPDDGTAPDDASSDEALDSTESAETSETTTPGSSGSV